MYKIKNQHHYIPPGNPNNLRYRFATFSKYPVTDSQRRMELAEQGFIYTGNYATIRCVYCLQEITKIHPGENTMKINHEANCKFGLNDQPTPPEEQTVIRKRPVLSTPVTIPAKYQHLDLYTEAGRRKTFKNWPTMRAPLLPEQLARAGFFYLGHEDQTQCISCNIILERWQKEHNPISEHALRSPDCKWAYPQPMRGNTPMSPISRQKATLEYCEELQRNNVIPIQNQTRYSKIMRPQEPPTSLRRNLQYLLGSTMLARHPEFRSLEARLNSFANNWLPPDASATLHDMASAGYFLAKDQKRIICFCCNDEIEDWHIYANPWIEHARISNPKCPFLVRATGPDYARRMSRLYGRRKRAFDDTSSAKQQVHHGTTPGQRKAPTCCVCLGGEVQVLFRPCSHVSTCQSCSERVSTCPTCRAEVKERLRAYVV